jgi:hypothetical protein
MSFNSISIGDIVGISPVIERGLAEDDRGDTGRVLDLSDDGQAWVGWRSGTRMWMPVGDLVTVEVAS